MKYLTDPAKAEPDVDKYAYVLSACACINLRKLSRVITQMYDDALKPSGLRSTQLPVLVTLVCTGPMTVNHLADDLVMDRTSLSRLLRPLVTRGLIETAHGQDRRTLDLSITPLGREFVEGAFPMWDRVQDEVLERLGQKLFRDLSDNLTVAAELIRT